MTHKSVLLAALVAGLLPVSAFAQASPAAAQPTAPAAAPASAAAAPVAPVPQAYPAKIALIAFEQCVIATNEGQRALEDIRKKYEPKQALLQGLNTEIETAKKQLQGGPATLTDAERAAKMKTIDTKQKQLDRETDDARTAYQGDLQDAYGKIAQKVNAVLVKYVESNGYTLLLDVGSQQSSVMWAAQSPSADITEAVVNAYNASTPTITAPAPAAPEPAQSAKPKPATTTPSHTTTTPHTTPTAPKPPSQ
jgi:outer membrane protein